jgi:hypothetical protein
MLGPDSDAPTQKPEGHVAQSRIRRAQDVTEQAVLGLSISDNVALP